MMQIRLLGKELAREVYEKHMKTDFPPDELKPFSAIEAMLEAGIYEPLGFFEGADGNELTAYAWQTVLPQCHSVLIDYFAVEPRRRGGGTGTKALALLADYYAPRKQALLIECEHPAEAPDAAAARRRIGFYLRAGARATAMESRVYGVRYQIFALPCTPNSTAQDTALNADLKEIYRVMVPEPYYRGNVIFYGA